MKVFSIMFAKLGVDYSVHTNTTNRCIAFLSGKDTVVKHMVGGDIRELWKSSSISESITDIIFYQEACLLLLEDKLLLCDNVFTNDKELVSWKEIKVDMKSRSNMLRILHSPGRDSLCILLSNGHILQLPEFTKLFEKSVYSLEMNCENNVMNIKEEDLLFCGCTENLICAVICTSDQHKQKRKASLGKVAMLLHKWPGSYEGTVTTLDKPFLLNLLIDAADIKACCLSQSNGEPAFYFLLGDGKFVILPVKTVDEITGNTSTIDLNKHKSSLISCISDKYNLHKYVEMVAMNEKLLTIVGVKSKASMKISPSLLIAVDISTNRVTSEVQLNRNIQSKQNVYLHNSKIYVSSGSDMQVIDTSLFSSSLASAIKQQRMVMAMSDKDDNTNIIHSRLAWDDKGAFHTQTNEKSLDKYVKNLEDALYSNDLKATAVSKALKKLLSIFDISCKLSMTQSESIWQAAMSRPSLGASVMSHLIKWNLVPNHIIHASVKKLVIGKDFDFLQSILFSDESPHTSCWHIDEEILALIVEHLLSCEFGCTNSLDNDSFTDSLRQQLFISTLLQPFTDSLLICYLRKTFTISTIKVFIKAATKILMTSDMNTSLIDSQLGLQISGWLTCLIDANFFNLSTSPDTYSTLESLKDCTETMVTYLRQLQVLSNTLDTLWCRRKEKLKILCDDYRIEYVKFVEIS